MLKNTEGAIKNGQSRETRIIGYTRRRKTEQNTIKYALDTTVLTKTHIMRWTPLYSQKHT